MMEKKKSIYTPLMHENDVKTLSGGSVGGESNGQVA